MTRTEELRMIASGEATSRDYIQSACSSAAIEIDRLRATIDASIRILSDEKSPLQSRVNDARGILARC